ncbi:MAG TPA: caspase family protein [Kofleriaceae bacterium]|nr:caspase family protein [Kofleriaceae bacterium]
MGEATKAASYHALLVGIDDYPSRPLRGCVNDIDAVQRILLGERAGIAPDRIRRLVSPCPGAVHDEAVPSRPATLANLRAALAELAGDAVSEGDRVLIYFAGHGSRAEVVAAGGRRLHREALVPVDGFRDRSDPRLMFDLELHARIAAITARTRNVTLVLDCGFSAGAIRLVSEEPARLARFLDGACDPEWHAPLVDPAAPGRASDRPRSLTRGLDDCHVVAACLDHERAHESLGADDVHHGLLTRALVNALAAVPDATLHAVTWQRIWQAMRAEVEDACPWQHLWMAGSPARAVLGGPPHDGDAGLSVMTDGARYGIAAGTLAGVTAGTRIAIYGPQPARFPRRDSPEDRGARVGGLIRVTHAGRASATAEPEGPPVELPRGARGRLVSAGAPDRLRCAIVPPDDALAARLHGSPVLELVEPARAQVRLERVGDAWLVTDDVHGSAGDGPILFALSRGELDRARTVLEHYRAYALPLQLAARATELPGGLELTLLVYPDRALSPAELRAASWPEAPARASATYELRGDARLCVRVANRSPRRLRVTLVDSAATGAVRMLGDQVIDAHTSDVMWPHGRPGTPLPVAPPSGQPRWIDRLTAIGRAAIAMDLGHLRVDRTFVETVGRASGSPDSSDASAMYAMWKTVPPPEQSTAAHAVLAFHAPRPLLAFPNAGIPRKIHRAM